MKFPLAIAGVALVGATLAGCGGDAGADSDYCKDLKTAKSTFADIESGDVAVLEKAFTTFHELADEAPSDVKDDWKKLDDGITTVEKALKDAGIKLSDFSKIQSGELPEGVDQSKLQDVATAFTKLSAQDFTDASTAIEKHAKDTCKVDLSAS